MQDLLEGKTSKILAPHFLPCTVVEIVEVLQIPKFIISKGGCCFSIRTMQVILHVWELLLLDDQLLISDLLLILLFV